MKLAFQGELGAFSHLAALQIYPQSEIKTCQTFEECFRLATEDSKFKIIIPIENSLAGRVADIHYLIPKYKLQIYAEYYHPVIHNLLGLKGTKLKDIITVRSHSQAIGQCQKIIQKNNLKPIITADTAGSARYISEKKDKTESAIASSLAAKIYGLEIIAKHVEDDSRNITRFLIMGKEIHHPEPENKKYITSCIFRVKSKPAALYKCLGGFATNNVNLCKLESFSAKNSFEQVNFFIDIEGHIENSTVQKSLEELGFHTESLDILGVYEADKFRFKK
jgi:prephenate dehydratase